MEDSTETPRTRAEINRQNGQKSTGPRTPEGKKAQRLLLAAPDKSSNSREFLKKEQRVFKQYHQTYAKLEAMQTARNRQERIDLSNAANLYSMHQAENPPSKDPEVFVPQYVPAQDGFVLQIPEIVAYIMREERLRPRP